MSLPDVHALRGVGGLFITTKSTKNTKERRTRRTSSRRPRQNEAFRGRGDRPAAPTIRAGTGACPYTSATHTCSDNLVDLVNGSSGLSVARDGTVSQICVAIAASNCRKSLLRHGMGGLGRDTDWCRVNRPPVAPSQSAWGSAAGRVAPARTPLSGASQPRSHRISPPYTPQRLLRFRRMNLVNLVRESVLAEPSIHILLLSGLHKPCHPSLLGGAIRPSYPRSGV